MKSFLSQKNVIFSKINTEKNNRIISYDFDLPGEFNTFFEDAVRSLNVNPYEYYLNYTETVEIPMKKFCTPLVFKLLSKIFQ